MLTQRSPKQQAQLDLIRYRQQAYRITFDTESEFTKTVLADLARFCRGNETTFTTDARTHALLEGRREVWLRIANHLNLSEEELYNLFVRGSAAG